jgi:hypothetical protein
VLRRAEKSPVIGAMLPSSPVGRRITTALNWILDFTVTGLTESLTTVSQEFVAAPGGADASQTGGSCGGSERLSGVQGAYGNRVPVSRADCEDPVLKE